MDPNVRPALAVGSRLISTTEDRTWACTETGGWRIESPAGHSGIWTVPVTFAQMRVNLLVAAGLTPDQAHTVLNNLDDGHNFLTSPHIDTSVPIEADARWAKAIYDQVMGAA